MVFPGLGGYLKKGNDDLRGGNHDQIKKKVHGRIQGRDGGVGECRTALDRRGCPWLGHVAPAVGAF